MPETKSTRRFLLLLAGGVLGILLVLGSYLTFEYTGSTAFCLKCHNSDTPSLVETYRTFVHFSNPSGVRTECGDCHIPHQIIPLLFTKVLALKDVIGEIRGTLDTPEKWKEKGPEMFASTRKVLSGQNSITCKHCHSMEAMDSAKQSHAARVSMAAALKEGNDNCVTCHRGIGHALPEGVEQQPASQLDTGGATAMKANTTVAESVPDPPLEYPAGELGETVKLGKVIFDETATHPLTRNFVGNSLSCTSCHLDTGTTKNIGTLIGTAAAFPAYSGREKTIQTLQNRNNNCFMRSMNGTRLIIDSQASVALAAYVTWLSEGVNMKMNEKKPVTKFYSQSWPGKKWVMPLLKKADHAAYLRGKNIYETRCAVCHNKKGMPWLWGEKSYNCGAGMSKLNKAPMWLLGNMPMGGGTLTRQAAVDAAIFINAQPRPDFDLVKHLPPEGSGPYNSVVPEEKSSVRSNFSALGLDVDMIRNDNAIP
jgi:thiosulfate dehydrogenase